MLRQSGIDVNISMLPSAGAIRPHLGPSLTTVRRTAAGIEITERRSLPGPGIGAAAPVAVALLLPAVSSSRTAARRAQSSNQLKQIALALHNYAQANRTFPPAYKSDKDGKPLLSWRVLILPYLEEGALYREFHLDEPWDSDHNKKLIARMPSTYKSPGSKVAVEGKTNYLTVRGEKTIFPGKDPIGFMEIRDGTSNTIMTVEVSDAKAVFWTKPDDFEYDEKDPLKGLIGTRPGGFYAGLDDGSVRFLPATIDPKTLNSLFTRNDGKVIDWSQIDR
jgi:type II secretory pathway pseudopilin PulG